MSTEPAAPVIPITHDIAPQWMQISYMSSICRAFVVDLTGCDYAEDVWQPIVGAIGRGVDVTVRVRAETQPAHRAEVYRLDTLTGITLEVEP